MYDTSPGSFYFFYFITYECIEPMFMPHLIFSMSFESHVFHFGFKLLRYEPKVENQIPSDEVWNIIIGNLCLLFAALAIFFDNFLFWSDKYSYEWYLYDREIRAYIFAA